MSDTIIANSSLVGSMSNETTIQQLPQGQMIATIPRALSQALGWQKGDVLQWQIKEGAVFLLKLEK